MRAEEFKLSESIDLYYWPTPNGWKDAKLSLEYKKAERLCKKRTAIEDDANSQMFCLIATPKSFKELCS